MAKFTRETLGQNKNMLHHIDPVTVVAKGVAGTLETGQVLAQSNADGLFYKYIKDDAAVGTIAGIYTGDSVTLVAGTDSPIQISTLVTTTEEDIVGMDFVADKAAISKLKTAGVFLVEKITGLEEAYE